MDQTSHAWIAVRAIKLLEADGKTQGLVDILKPYAKKASIGAWIPDQRDAKLGGAQTQNHVFKIGTFDGVGKERFVTKKAKLLDHLGSERSMAAFLEKYSDILDTAWWAASYKADPPPGKHLANRAMALTINNIDMLILGDKNIHDKLPKKISFIKNVPDDCRCLSGQISMFFFMLSHFIADSLMPCHSDLRDLSDYSNGLHMELEKYWSSKIGTQFSEKKILESDLDPDQILEKAALVDNAFGIELNSQVPAFKDEEAWDIWSEIVLLCRSSFGVASIIAPPAIYPYKPAAQVMAPFDLLFKSDDKGKALLTEMTQVIMHDAVLNVAMVWRHIWTRFN